MIKSIKQLFVVLVLVAVAYAGFRWGPIVFPPLERALGIAPPEVESEVLGGPTPEIAEATLDRFEAFRAGEAGDRLALGGGELSSVVRYALPGMVPPGVSEPTVEMEGEEVKLSARVAVDAFPELPALDQVIGLLPDTMLVEVSGSLRPLDQATLALHVEKLRAARIPIPRRLFAEVLEGFGRSGPSSLPPEALLVPKPDGLDSIFVHGDSLVMLAKKGGAD